MFYEVLARTHVRVPPQLFKEKPAEAITAQLRQEYENYTSKEIGIILAIVSVESIGEGVIIPGDGAAYYDTKFKFLLYRPEPHEFVTGKVTEISDFGAFVDIGAVDGMVHISQTMDDFVTYSKSNILAGKESKRTLKVGDVCRARIIAVSYKDIANPKIGLTMRQPALGKLEWLKEDAKKSSEDKPKEKKEEKKAKAKAA